MIRPEKESDASDIRAVHRAAFSATAEAELVDALRANDNLLVACVAVDKSHLVGHVAFSPVTISGALPVGAGLAPLAVLPSHQGRGYGAALICAGLEACREKELDYVVVLGEPNYYSRFGFVAASKFRLDNEYGVDDEFMVVELTPNCLADVKGLVRYGEEFQILS